MGINKIPKHYKFKSLIKDIELGDMFTIILSQNGNVYAIGQNDLG